MSGSINNNQVNTRTTVTNLAKGVAELSSYEQALRMLGGKYQTHAQEVAGYVGATIHSWEVYISELAKSGGSFKQAREKSQEILSLLVEEIREKYKDSSALGSDKDLINKTNLQLINLSAGLIPEIVSTPLVMGINFSTIEISRRIHNSYHHNKAEQQLNFEQYIDYEDKNPSLRFIRNTLVLSILSSLGGGMKLTAAMSSLGILGERLMMIGKEQELPGGAKSVYGFNNLIREVFSGQIPDELLNSMVSSRSFCLFASVTLGRRISGAYDSFLDSPNDLLQSSTRYDEISDPKSADYTSLARFLGYFCLVSAAAIDMFDLGTGSPRNPYSPSQLKEILGYAKKSKKIEDSSEGDSQSDNSLAPSLPKPPRTPLPAAMARRMFPNYEELVPVGAVAFPPPMKMEIGRDHVPGWKSPFPIYNQGGDDSISDSGGKDGSPDFSNPFGPSNHNQKKSFSILQTKEDLVKLFKERKIDAALEIINKLDKQNISDLLNLKEIQGAIKDYFSKEVIEFTKTQEQEALDNLEKLTNSPFFTLNISRAARIGDLVRKSLKKLIEDDKIDSAFQLKTFCEHPHRENSRNQRVFLGSDYILNQIIPSLFIETNFFKINRIKEVFKYTPIDIDDVANKAIRKLIQNCKFQAVNEILENYPKDNATLNKLARIAIYNISKKKHLSKDKKKVRIAEIGEESIFELSFKGAIKPIAFAAADVLCGKKRDPSSRHNYIHPNLEFAASIVDIPILNKQTGKETFITYVIKKSLISWNINDLEVSLFYLNQFCDILKINKEVIQNAAHLAIEYFLNKTDFESAERIKKHLRVETETYYSIFEDILIQKISHANGKDSQNSISRFIEKANNIQPEKRRLALCYKVIERGAVGQYIHCSYIATKNAKAHQSFSEISNSLCQTFKMELFSEEILKTGFAMLFGDIFSSFSHTKDHLYLSILKQAGAEFNDQRRNNKELNEILTTLRNKFRQRIPYLYGLTIADYIKSQINPESESHCENSEKNLVLFERLTEANKALDERQKNEVVLAAFRRIISDPNFCPRDKLENAFGLLKETLVNKGILDKNNFTLIFNQLAEDILNETKDSEFTQNKAETSKETLLALATTLGERIQALELYEQRTNLILEHKNLLAEIFVIDKDSEDAQVLDEGISFIEKNFFQLEEKSLKLAELLLQKLITRFHSDPEGNKDRINQLLRISPRIREELVQSNIIFLAVTTLLESLIKIDSESNIKFILNLYPRNSSQRLRINTPILTECLLNKKYNLAANLDEEEYINITNSSLTLAISKVIEKGELDNVENILRHPDFNTICDQNIVYQAMIQSLTNILSEKTKNLKRQKNRSKMVIKTFGISEEIIIQAITNTLSRQLDKNGDFSLKHFREILDIFNLKESKKSQIITEVFSTKLSLLQTLHIAEAKTTVSRLKQLIKFFPSQKNLLDHVGELAIEKIILSTKNRSTIEKQTQNLVDEFKIEQEKLKKVIINAYRKLALTQWSMHSHIDFKFLEWKFNINLDSKDIVEIVKPIIVSCFFNNEDAQYYQNAIAVTKKIIDSVPQRFLDKKINTYRLAFNAAIKDYCVLSLQREIEIEHFDEIERALDLISGLNCKPLGHSSSHLLSSGRIRESALSSLVYLLDLIYNPNSEQLNNYEKLKARELIDKFKRIFNFTNEEKDEIFQDAMFLLIRGSLFVGRNQVFNVEHFETSLMFIVSDLEMSKQGNSSRLFEKLLGGVSKFFHDAAEEDIDYIISNQLSFVNHIDQFFGCLVTDFSASAKLKIQLGSLLISNALANINKFVKHNEDYEGFMKIKVFIKTISEKYNIQEHESKLTSLMIFKELMIINSWKKTEKLQKLCGFVFQEEKSCIDKAFIELLENCENYGEQAFERLDNIVKKYRLNPQDIRDCLTEAVKNRIKKLAKKLREVKANRTLLAGLNRALLGNAGNAELNYIFEVETLRSIIYFASTKGISYFWDNFLLAQRNNLKLEKDILRNLCRKMGSGENFLDLPLP